MNWTDEIVQRMLALLAEGHSTQVVADRIGTTKNAVIGKARRMGWEGRPSPIIRDGRIPQKSHKKGGGKRGEKRPKALAVGHVEQDASPELIRRLAELAASLVERIPPPPETRFQPPKPGSCLWPMWSGRATHEYCGHEAQIGKPYCVAHHAIAYTGGARALETSGFLAPAKGVKQFVNLAEFDEAAA